MTIDPVPQRPSGDLDEDERGSLLPMAQEPDSLNVEPVMGLDLPFPNAGRIRWINFVLGAAFLLPWNAMITAMPYFLSRLAGSPMEATFASYLTATFTASNFCFLAHATAMCRQSDFSRHIRRSLLALTLLVFSLTISTVIPSPPSLFFFLVLLNGICQASAGAYLQNAVVALASLFGPKAIQALMSGQAAIGVLVSLIQVFSVFGGIQTTEPPKVSVGDDAAAARAAFVFFGISTLFLMFSMASYEWLVTMPAYKAIVVPFEAKKRFGGSLEEREGLVGDGRRAVNLPMGKSHVKGIVKINAVYNFAVAYVFAVTLSVFPPITSAIRSVHPPSSSVISHPLLFTSIHFLVFNVGDFVGRYLPMVRWLQIWSSQSHLYMSLARTLFIPLFLLCNVQRPSSLPDDVPKGVLINSDIMFFLILLFFGLSNGYVSSVVMMAAPSPQHNPRLKHRPEDVDIAATVAQFFLVGGLALGSLLSFGVRGAICACNPLTA